MSGSSNSELVVASGGAGLAAVCAPAGDIDDADRARVQQAAGRGSVLHERSGCADAAAWVSGRLDDLEAIARDLEMTSAPPERIVVAGYQRWGDSFFRRLRGMFLLVVWDPARGATLVVTDHLGCRSPYVMRASGKLYVATDTAVLRRLTPMALAPDPVSLVHWLVSDVPAVDRSLFAGAERPLGGTYLTIDRSGIRTTTYWLPRFEEPLRIGVDEAAEILWEALRTSVRRRLTGVERPGIIMSGGVDSTAVAAAATTLDGEPPAAYSAVFPGHRVDESARIDAVVDSLDLSSVQAALDPVGAFALSLDYLDRWSLPGTGAGYMIEYPLLAEAAADGVTTVLDGQGGDELFALSGFLIADRVAQGRLLSSLRLTRGLPGARGRSRRQLLTAWQYYVQGGLAPYRLHAALKERRAVRSARWPWLTGPSRDLLAATDESLEWKRDREAPRWWTHKAYLLTRGREDVRITDYLRERAAIAGLEAAPPLLDVDLVETALRIPPEVEFDPDLDRPLIRRATNGLLPDPVRLSVAKSNLAPFYVETAAGRDLPAMRAVLTASDLRIGRFVDEQAIGALVAGPPAASGWPAWRWQCDLWRLSTVECWLRHLENPSSVAALLDGISLERPSWRIHRRRVPRGGALTQASG
ncbi:MAG TPA: asparagine synthase-related protein [Gaiellaceae bacterium]|nr:asparagine synthase-related protein [Gaiellaceae bacterium]